MQGGGQSKEAGAPRDLIHQAQKVREGYCMMLNAAHAGWERRKGSGGWGGGVSATFYPEEGGIKGQRS